ncbi:nucleotidyltransferase family protein [Aurantiacibacter sp. MUD11]|uniref:nucleotidyltransferase domain-containing protein n=1 Tax=Aurantiacibacter sp. MUD11 TaxID=3003265 RepID=UPI0022AA8037|nr:nucleotidyltransferase family protein [Aurantiacibacter sp. MUD11]WAT18935.1 nucleotidyltransferase family protein [Aurantiacibacter sp. MUD11]
MHSGPDPLPKALILDILLRPECVDQDRIDQVSAEQWSMVVERLKEHRALPYFQHALAECDNIKLPAKPAAEIAAIVQLWATRQLLLGRECILINRALADQGIEHLFLKGVPLAFQVYPSPIMRPAQDIDLLVRPDDAQRAWQCIRDLCGEDQSALPGLPTDPSAKAKHLTPIWSPNRVVPVEVHSRICSGSADHASKLLDRFTEGFWDRSSSFEISGQSLPCPGPQDMALHLILHSVYDDAFANGPNFLVDLRRLMDWSRLDTDALLQQARQLGIERGTELALAMIGEERPDSSVSEEQLRDAEHLIFKSNLDGGKMALNLVRLFHREGWALASNLLRRSFHSREELLARRRFANLKEQAGWSYPMLWLDFVVRRLGLSLRYLMTGKGRDAARNLTRFRNWLHTRQ